MFTDMVNRMTFAHNGMNQDITKSKHPVEFYYAANNIRIFANRNGTSYSAETEGGNQQVIVIPSVHIDTVNTKINYNRKSLHYRETADSFEIRKSVESGIMMRDSYNQVIIGYGLTRDGVILITTDTNRSGKKGLDCIWEIKNVVGDQFDLELKYCRNMGLSIDHPVQMLYNFENSKIEKIYWIDGIHQIRFINLRHSIENGDTEELIDLNLDMIDLVGTYDLSQPIIQDVSSGGEHTSGMIQYAYNLYKLNSSQTTISPLTELVPLNKGHMMGGGKINELVGTVPIVRVDNIDSRYTHIKLYAIKYTSYNQIPNIYLVADAEIGQSRSFTYFDDGAKIEDLSLEEFIFLGSDPTIPKHISIKDSRLFAANNTEMAFDVDIDCRAYSFNSNGVAAIHNNVKPSTGNPTIPTKDGTIWLNGTNYDSVYKEHDAVNLDYDTYKYQIDGETLGGTGKFIEYELVKAKFSSFEERSKYRLFKDHEIYRIGIEFYNILGQVSPVKWIADFRAPRYNMGIELEFTTIPEIKYTANTLSVRLTDEFRSWLVSAHFEKAEDRPVGYRIVRADRKISDRTIMCQGSLTQMMARVTHDLEGGGGNTWTFARREEESKSLIKFPITVSRGFDNDSGSLGPLKPLRWTSHLQAMTSSGGSSNNGGIGRPNPTEIWEGREEDEKKQYTWQYTKMYQMHSPDVLFNTGISFGEGMQLHIKGMVSSTKNDIMYKRLKHLDFTETLSVREEDTDNLINNPHVSYLGLFGPSEAHDTMDFTSINREYGAFIPPVNDVTVPIYGAPEITDRGQGSTSYNNNGYFKYANRMSYFLSDSHGGGQGDQEAILSMNSWGERCVTIVEGGATKPYKQRLNLEQLFNMTGITYTKEGLLLGEIRIAPHRVYLGNIYGGNSYDAKNRNTYIPIGHYKKIDDYTVTIDSPGDTHVGMFKFARLSKTDTVVRDNQVLQHTDIMRHPVETTVDLRNRSDKSIMEWDTDFQPAYDDFHDYNRVYSQQPTLIQNIAFDGNFKKIKLHDNEIIASKVKIPGEKIDAWTDFLANEKINLDGIYGPITGLVNHSDTIYAFQDSAIAMLSINPRVQVQGSDGLSVELGTGEVLNDYKYITTKSGTLNKWSIVDTPVGFYYYDILNNSWNRFTSEGLQKLGDAYGMHTYFENNVRYKDIKLDNPLLRKGVTSGYNPITNEIYLTVLQGDDSFTICFNEAYNVFTSFYDYKPSMYIIKGSKMMTPSVGINDLWLHGLSKHGRFYNEIFPSSITYLVNPPGRDNVFNNISYKSEAYNTRFVQFSDDISIESPIEAKKTLSHIKVYNEYQSTALTPLILNKNIIRKERMWSARIPRVEGSLDRMRGHWVYLKVVYDNLDNYRLVLHDMNVDYTQYP